MTNIPNDELEAVININTLKEITVLHQFLEFDLNSSDQLFDKFRTLDHTIYRHNTGEDQERFLFREGTRERKILLIAHADTIWDKCFGYGPVDQRIEEEYGCYMGNNSEYGIAADSRAACAMLWLLKDMGHSILLLDGSECEMVGSNWLMNNHQDVVLEINKHQFIIELNSSGDLFFECSENSTKDFIRYIVQKSEFEYIGDDTMTDLSVLCKDLPGVNFSIGYHFEHQEKEYINIQQWSNTLQMLKRLLGEKEFPRF
jgi:hypothetical protein